MRKIWSGLLAAGMLTATAAVTAQVVNPANPSNTPPPDANQRPGVQQTRPAPAAEGEVKNTVTIAGCLQNAPAGASTTGRGSTRTAASAGFVLANPQITASGDLPARGAPGAVGTTGGGASAAYTLDGDVKLLSPHVNHQVRVTGTLQSGSSASATGANRAAAASTAAGTTLKVEKVEMVSDTCATVNTGRPDTTPRGAPAEPAQPARPAQPGRGGQPTQPADPARPAQPAVPPAR